MHVLTIAGSDPSAGAGIQRDLKTFEILGAYGSSVITAITSQNTSGFFDVEPVSKFLVKSQIRAIISDSKIEAIKIGMVYDKQIIRIIYSEVKGLDVPVVIDPVFESTTGGVLLLKNAFADFKKLLLPLAYVVTPNVSEAEKITDFKIKTIKDVKKAAKKIQDLGAKNVVIKGAYRSQSDTVVDTLLEDNKFYNFSHKRLEFENHGGGCTYSAALCVGLARDKTLHKAVEFAHNFTFQAIKKSKKMGKGVAIIGKPKNDNTIESSLSQAITKFSQKKHIYRYIPECQTNFVYAYTNPSSLNDVLGLEGRIVKTGKSVTSAGELKYGGSRHVALAILEITKKFPAMRSALNIRYDNGIISRASKNGFHVLSYHRELEPKVIQKKEGRTISWGIKEAISKTRSPPDIIYHRGGVGKEPMIIIFGSTPQDVLRKLDKIVI